jgi:hypothetical protein
MRPLVRAGADVVARVTDDLSVRHLLLWEREDGLSLPFPTSRRYGYGNASRNQLMIGKSPGVVRRATLGKKSKKPQGGVVFPSHCEAT